MSIADYSYIVTLGQNCTPSFQLARAAARLRLPKAQISGPFDWFMLDIAQSIGVIETKFRHYFDPEHVTADTALGGAHWRATDAAGIRSWHHLPRGAADVAPSPANWFKFGKWLGRRLALWERAVSNPRGRVLVVRLSDAAVPDTALDVERLAATLTAAAMAPVVIAAVSFCTPLTLSHPNVKTFAVRPSWPAHIDPLNVEWHKDYGTGAAWKGHDASWDTMWDAV